jgi:hypothetical protein
MARWTQCADPASGLCGIPESGWTRRCLGSRVPPHIDLDPGAYQRFCPSGTASATASMCCGSRRRGLPRDPVRRITEFAVACRACRAMVNGTAATLRTRFRPRFRPPGPPTPGIPEISHAVSRRRRPPPSRWADPNPPGPAVVIPRPGTSDTAGIAGLIAGHRAQPRACITGPSKQNAGQSVAAAAAADPIARPRLS